MQNQIINTTPIESLSLAQIDQRIADISGSVSGALIEADIGVRIAPLLNGLVPVANLPKIVFLNFVVVANETERFALTKDQVQTGDIVKQTDNQMLYFIVDDNNLNNASGYVEFSFAMQAIFITYNNLTSGLDAVDLQSAIDEIVSLLQTKAGIDVDNYVVQNTKAIKTILTENITTNTNAIEKGDDLQTITNKIKTYLENLSSQFSSVSSGLSQEIIDRTSADTTLQTQITTNTNDITSIKTEQTTQNTNISNNATAIANETTNRINADTALQTQITTNTNDIAIIEEEQLTQNANIANNTAAIANKMDKVAGTSGYLAKANGSGGLNISGVTEADVSNAKSNITKLQNLALSQMVAGFEPSKESESILSFDNATRTFTITPTSPTSGYKIFVNGRIDILSVQSAYSVIIPNTIGMHYLYFEYIASTLTLTATTTFSDDIILNKAHIANIYWNGQYALLDIQNERHTYTRNPQWHKSHHLEFGTTWRTGLLPDVVAGGDASQDIHAQFAISAGTIYDEDLPSNSLLKAKGDSTPIIYRVGSVWFQDISNFIVKTGANNRPYYNQNVAGSYQLTEMPSGKFGICHIVAGTSINDSDKVFIVMGTQIFDDIATARTQVALQPDMSGLPFQEFKVIAGLIFKTDSAFTNTVKTKINFVNDALTQSFVDFRAVSLTGQAVVESNDITQIYNRLDAVEGEASQNTTDITTIQSQQTTQDSRLDVIQGDNTVSGSIQKALKDSKDYTDTGLATKYTKLVSYVANNVVAFGSDGELIDTGISKATLGIIDGEVNTYADLPTASQHNGDIFIVKTTTGTIYIDRHVAGFYISNGSIWSIINPINIDGYQTLITNPTANNIATMDSNGQTINSNKSFSTSTTLTENSDNVIATQKAIKAYVDAETTARQSADTTLQNNINLKANSSDVYTKTQIDTSQATQDTNISNNATAIANETTNRINADTALQTQITTNTNNIATNTSDITTIKTEQITQNTNITTNANNIALKEDIINTNNFERYVSSTGSDTTGKGTITKPYATYGKTLTGAQYPLTIKQTGQTISEIIALTSSNSNINIKCDTGIISRNNSILNGYITTSTGFTRLGIENLQINSGSNPCVSLGSGDAGRHTFNCVDFITTGGVVVNVPNNFTNWLNFYNCDFTGASSGVINLPNLTGTAILRLYDCGFVSVSIGSGWIVYINGDTQLNVAAKSSSAVIIDLKTLRTNSVITTQVALNALIALTSGADGAYIVNFASPTGISNLSRGDVIWKVGAFQGILYPFIDAPASVCVIVDATHQQTYIKDATNFWVAGGSGSGGGTWGSITGTLSDQADLQTALNAKATDSAVVHNTGAETVGGVKTFPNSPIFSGLNASQRLELDASKNLISVAKKTADNQDFETSAANIKMNGSVSVGTSNNVAASDHVHPSDTTKLSLAGGTMSGTISFPNNVAIQSSASGGPQITVFKDATNSIVDIGDAVSGNKFRFDLNQPLVASKVMITGENKEMITSVITPTQLNQLSGISTTDTIQYQIDGNQGTAIASAATVNIGSSLGLGKSIHITGTTGITSFGTAAKAGITKTLYFDEALTITHNASTLVCPNGVDFSSVAGTILEVYADTTTKWIIKSVGGASSYLWANVTGAISNLLTTNLTANCALVSDANGKIAVLSTVSSTELGYLNGVTSAIQTQLNAKCDLPYTGTTTSNITISIGQAILCQSNSAQNRYSRATVYLFNGDNQQWIDQYFTDTTKRGSAMTGSFAFYGYVGTAVYRPRVA